VQGWTAVKDLIRIFRKLYAVGLTFTTRVEQANLDLGRVSGEDREIRAVAIPTCSQRIG
jgi:hypothetical protein